MAGVEGKESKNASTQFAYSHFINASSLIDSIANCPRHRVLILSVGHRTGSWLGEHSGKRTKIEIGNRFKELRWWCLRLESNRSK